MKRFLAASLALVFLSAVPPALFAQDGSKLTEKASCSTPQATDLFWLVRGSTTDLQCSYSAVESTILAGALTFKTIDAPSGTDPVADSSTDTLALAASGGITITGDSSTDTVTFATTGLAPYSQYDPMKPPSAPHACTDEFAGGLEETWTGQNVGTSTFTAALDGVAFADATAAGANDRAVYWNQCGSKPTDSFTVITKGTMHSSGSGASASIVLLESGTEATPSKAIICEVTEVSGIFKVRFGTFTSYTGSASNVAGTLLNLRGTAPALIEFWLRTEYDDGADTVKCAASLDGINWAQSQNAYTLTTDPLGLGIHGNSFDTFRSRFEFFRVRTDANRLQASD